MRTAKSRTFLPALALALLLAPAAASAQVDTGSSDFTRFVAIGDSLGAGFSSGSLIEPGQRNSFPSLIHQQAVGGAFEQPLVSPPGIPGILELRSLQPLVIAPAPGNGVPINLNLPRPYDNLSVPGFDMGDASQTRTGNPIIDLTLRGIGTQLEQAAFLQPSFVMLYLGSNDVLGAALSGVAVEGVTLTPVAEFTAELQVILQTLAAVGTQQGATATIPNVTAVPFVTTLPPVVLDPATSQPLLINGQPVPLVGETISGVRALGPGDFVLLTATGELAQGRGLPPALGGTGPLSTFVVLDRDEVALIQDRVDALNAVIRQAAQDNGFALVDVNGIFDEVVDEGLHIAGIDYTAELFGGLFSLDGFHASPMGYAVIANAFIEAINETYGGNIPSVNLSRFVFGAEGQLPTGGGTLVASELSFTSQAWRSLRKSLRLPGKKALKRAIKKQQRQEAREARRSERREGRRVTGKAVRSTRLRVQR